MEQLPAIETMDKHQQQQQHTSRYTDTTITLHQLTPTSPINLGLPMVANLQPLFGTLVKVLNVPVAIDIFHQPNALLCLLVRRAQGEATTDSFLSARREVNTATVPLKTSTTRL